MIYEQRPQTFLINTIQITDSSSSNNDDDDDDDDHGDDDDDDEDDDDGEDDEDGDDDDDDDDDNDDEDDDDDNDNGGVVRPSQEHGTTRPRNHQFGRKPPPLPLRIEHHPLQLHRLRRFGGERGVVVLC